MKKNHTNKQQKNRLMISALSKSTITYRGAIPGFHPISLKTF